MPRKFVTPKADTLVPDPAHGDYLPPEGRWVNWSVYWVKSERDGSIVAADSGPPDE